MKFIFIISILFSFTVLADCIQTLEVQSMVNRIEQLEKITKHNSAVPVGLNWSFQETTAGTFTTQLRNSYPGDWVASFERRDRGNYRLVFKNNLFKNVPVCTCSGGDYSSCTIFQPSQSSIVVILTDLRNAQRRMADEVKVICMGDRNDF